MPSHRPFATVLLLLACLSPSARASSAAADRYPLLERQRLRVDNGSYVRSKDGLRPGGGYLGFTQSADMLMPDERSALEALARRDGPSSLGITVPVHAAGELSVRRGPLTIRRRVLGARRARATLDGGLVRYEEALPHTDILVIADDLSAEQLFSLKDGGSPWPIRVAWDVGEGRLQEQDDGSLVVRQPDGAPAFTVAPPVVVDADSRERKGRWTAMESGPGRYVAYVLFDPAGLRYPLLID